MKIRYADNKILNTSEVDVKFLEEMEGKLGLGSSMIISKDLGNASHFDKDYSKSISIWVEENPGLASNWYFILPNVKIGNRMGLVIKLKHGRVIEWDTRLLRHCISVMDIGPSNHVYGMMIGSINA